MSEALTWGALIAALGAIIAAVKFWMDLGVTQQKATGAHDSADEAHKRIDRLVENSASKADIVAAEKRFTEAVNGLRADFQHMAQRLDTILATLVKQH